MATLNPRTERFTFRPQDVIFHEERNKIRTFDSKKLKVRVVSKKSAADSE